MAFHEQHERECPACGARISATAPKCLNCGRFVDEDEEDPEPDAASSRWLVLIGGAALLVGLALAAVYLF